MLLCIAELLSHDHFDDKERCDDRHSDFHLTSATRQDLNSRIADEANANTVSDGEGERHRDGCDNGGDEFCYIVPIKILEAHCHQASDIEQRGRCGKGRNRSSQWREENRRKKAEGHDDSGEAGAPARPRIL